MKAEDILYQPIKAVNLGLDLLGEGLNQQETDTVVISWRPPRQVKLSPRVAEILSKIED